MDSHLIGMLLAFLSDQLQRIEAHQKTFSEFSHQRRIC